jgi:hypothetical protein
MYEPLWYVWMIRRGSSRLGCVVPVCSGGDFRSPLLVDFLVRFWDIALGDLVRDVCVNPSWSFSL